ncbi:hypothetical protein ACTFIZ_011473 [Dictyostelium cf. discoideum]
MKILTILFLFIFYFNFSNSQFKPLSIESTIQASVVDEPTYVYTPVWSDDSYCLYKTYQIYLTVQSGFSITSATTDNINFFIEKKFQKQNSYLFALGTQYTQQFGINSQVITFSTDDTTNHTYELTTTCNDFQLNNLNVSEYLTPFYFSGSFNYYISLTGLEKSDRPVQLRIKNSIASVIVSGESRFNYLLQIYQFTQQNITDDFDLEIDFNNNRYLSFKLKSYYSQFNEIDLPTSHIETFYPAEIISTEYRYNQFGSGCNPVVQSTINTNIIRPYQYLFLMYSSKFSLPIKGTKGNMTFIGSLMTGTKLVTGNGYSSIDSTEYNPNITDLNIPLMEPHSFSISQDTTEIPINTVFFNNGNQYQGTDLYFFIYAINVYQSWPYGFYSGNNVNYEFKTSFIRIREASPIAINYFYFGLSQALIEVYQSLTFPTKVSTPPQLISYKYTKVSDYMYILSLHIESSSGVKSISTFSPSELYGAETLVSGTIYNGVFEIVGTPDQVLFVSIYDHLGYTKDYNPGDVISIDPLIIFNLPSEITFVLNITSFNITFLENNLDLTDNSYNIMYIDFNENVPTDKSLCLVLLDIISFPIERDSSDSGAMIVKLPFKYNTQTKKFECKFIVPKNNMFGNILYIIFYGNLLGMHSNELSEKLFVNNTILDNQGPLFSSFEKIGNGLVISTTGTIGWKFNITDDLNGFESGYIKVMGSIDSSTYHFNFTIDDVIGDKFNCQYQILINITQPCISQEYRIIKVILFDTNKIASKFYLYTPVLQTASILNPFLNLLNKSIEITTIPFTCSDSTLVDSKPTLLSFTPSTTTIDVGAANRTISFDFSFGTSTSTIKQDQLPIVYINSLYSGLVECRETKILSYSNVEVFYKCSKELPIGFGFPNELIFSIYGVVNNGGYFYGYTPKDLSLVSSSYYANTTFSFNQPIIKSTDKFYSDDKDLVLYGRGFSNVNQVNIVYRDSNLAPHSLSPLAVYESSAIKISGIKLTNKPFDITFSTTDSLTSNIYTVNPIYFNATGIPIPTESPSNSPTESPTSTPTESPTTTPIPTITPIPTNPPQKCLGNPECGGKNQGYCSPTGCICYSPWIGTTCTSQIIIVPQPSTNTTKPDVEIPTDNIGQSSETNSEESQKMIFKSLISLVSLRELDFNNEEVNNYKFDQWIYTPINEFKNQYFTTISNTNITTTLEWFNQSTSIQFANQNLTMNPSSIKYTIEITKYQFKSSLNQLQLIMAASLTTNSNDICSLNQFGNTSTGDDSNYLKIQIENHSLYGRFIKRAMIDNTVKSITNVLLDSSLNVIDSSSSLQSFIGITIPYYRNSIIVDPDFSVLIDSKSASDDDDSVCTKNNSGLTTAQLAGIIVGSIAFAAVIVISTVYAIIKSKKQKKFQISMNNKLNKLNNN